MSAEKEQNAATKPEDFECEITEVKVKEENKENIDVEHTDSSDNSSNQSINRSGGSTRKRKRSKAPPGKPPYSYVALITMAITSSPWGKMTLAEIHKFINDNFPYYRNCPLKWRNAIRHNLKLNDCFVKLPRDAHDQNRGHYWTVDPASEMMFGDGSFRRRKRRFTRQEDVSEILPLLVERTNIPSYDTRPQSVQAIPYYPRVPVITPQRRGFTIDDILAPRQTLLNNSVPAISTYPQTSPIQLLDRRYQSSAIPYHPEVFWSPPMTYTVPGRTFSFTC